MAKININSAPGTGGGGSGGNLQLLNGAAMGASLISVSDTANTASPLKLSTASVQVNSPLRITTSDASGFYLDAEDSATNNRFSIKRDPSSQEVTLDFASNPAGSTTLVGAIRTYGDGVNLSNAMSFLEDGSVGIGTNTPVGILHIKKTAANTRLAIDGDAGFNKLISYRTAGLQRFGLYVNNTAESGSNVGSDFAVRAYNDAGTLITTPLFIKRSTGFLGVGNVTAPTQQLHVNGSLRIETGGIYDGTNSIGTSGQVLSSTGTATAWITPSTTTPAGSTGAVQFNNAGAFGADSTQLFWDDTNNRLGVGTATPTAKIHAVGNGSTSATTSLLVQNSASTKLFDITDDGRVTIGQTGTNSGALLFQFPQVGTNGVFWGDNYSTIYGSLTLSRGTGEMRMACSAGGYFQTFQTANVERMRIDQSGNVLIGTSTTTASAIVDITSTTKGFLPPRMTNAQRLLITTPAVGLMVYCTDAVEGLYVYKSTGWTFVI